MENRRIRSLRSSARKPRNSAVTDLTPFRQGIAAMQMSPGIPLLNHSNEIEQQQLFKKPLPVPRVSTNKQEIFSLEDKENVIANRFQNQANAPPLPKQQLQRPYSPEIQTPVQQTHPAYDERPNDQFKSEIMDESIVFNDSVDPVSEFLEELRESNLRQRNSWSPVEADWLPVSNGEFEPDLLDEPHEDLKSQNAIGFVSRLKLLIRRIIVLTVFIGMLYYMAVCSIGLASYAVSWWYMQVPAPLSDSVTVAQLQPSDLSPITENSKIIVNEMLFGPVENVEVEEAFKSEIKEEIVDDIPEPKINFVTEEQLAVLQEKIASLQEQLNAIPEEKPHVQLSEVQTLIDRAFDAYQKQQIGYADYALLQTGGLIVHQLTSPTFVPELNSEKVEQGLSISGYLGWLVFGKNKQDSVKTQLRNRVNRPEIAITDTNNSPGTCWPFAGDQGNLTVQLARPVIPTKFTLEHLSRQQALANDVSSAPKHVKVLAYTEDSNGPEVVADFTYDTELSQNKQTFSVKQLLFSPVRIIQLQILSNHGNPSYTCVYRFQVHGIETEGRS